MSEVNVSAKDASVAVGGDVSGNLLNVKTGSFSPVQITIQQEIARALPTQLGLVIAFFAAQSLAEYAMREVRELGPEIVEKLEHNALSPNHHMMVEYSRHYHELDRAYAGAEQQNQDARYLVMRRTRLAYGKVVQSMPGEGKSDEQRLDYIRANASSVIDEVIAMLVRAYTASGDEKVSEEHAHMAISLIVADALVECEVLERPRNAPTA